MAPQCPECGASVREGDSCTDRFYRFLALEFSGAEYGAVHHLTVSTYMLQHPSRLSLRGWLEMRELLALALDQGLNPEALRAKMGSEIDSGHRSWSLVKGPRLQLPTDFTWSLTILSVDESDAGQYRLGIQRWARQVLADANRIDLQ